MDWHGVCLPNMHQIVRSHHCTSEHLTVKCIEKIAQQKNGAKNIETLVNLASFFF